MTGTYQGRGFFSIGGMVGLQATYQQHGETVNGPDANNQGDFGMVQGRAQGTMFEGRTISQAFQGVLCDFFSEVGGEEGKTIQGNVTCKQWQLWFFCAGTAVVARGFIHADTA